MKIHDFDILVIGGGCVGSAIFHELTRNRFRSVALVDQGRKTVSATAFSGGMFRVFHESLEHVALSLASYDRLLELQSAKVLSPMHVTGALYFFNVSRLSGYSANLHLMSQAGYPFEVLGSEAGEQRFPQFTWGKDVYAIYEPLAGTLQPAQFTDELLLQGVAQGGKVFEDFEVMRICSYRDHYRIASPNGVVTARSIVLAGGVRLLPRLRDLGIQMDLKVVPLTAYATSEKPLLEVPNYFDRESLRFGGTHAGGAVVSSVLHSLWNERFYSTEKLEKRLANDCYAPDRQGYLGSVSGQARLYLATGWGGTAFKFSLEIGCRISRSVAQEFAQRSAVYACV